MTILYTPEEIAKKLRVSKKAVYLWLQQGKLKGCKIASLWRVTREALEEFTGLKWEDESSSSTW